MLFLSLYLVTVFLITNNAIDSANGKILFYFSNTHLDLLLLYFIGAAFNNKLFPNQLHFNPLQLVAPAPLPESSQVLKDSGYEKQFIKGIIGIVIAQTIFVFLIYFLQLESVANTRNPFIYYFAFIFTVIGAMKMASSLLWIYGIKTISATYFLLLAKSPIEIWQRGSVFIADFLFNKIYLPVWKRSRSTTLSATLVILAVLLHLFVFHEILVKTLLRLQFGDTLFGTFGVTEVLQWGLWLLVWLIWILAFSVFSNLTKSLHPKPAFQWLLVVITHLGSAMIFPTVFYLASVIRF